MEESNVKEKPKDGGDDGMDALRYLLTYLSKFHGGAIDMPFKNGTIAEGQFLVHYENGEVKGARPRKVPRWERQSQSFNEYGEVLTWM
mgnify:FL=1